MLTCRMRIEIVIVIKILGKLIGKGKGKVYNNFISQQKITKFRFQIRQKKQIKFLKIFKITYITFFFLHSLLHDEQKVRIKNKSHTVYRQIHMGYSSRDISRNFSVSLFSLFFFFFFFFQHQIYANAIKPGST